MNDLQNLFSKFDHNPRGVYSDEHWITDEVGVTEFCCSGHIAMGGTLNEVVGYLVDDDGGVRFLGYYVTPRHRRYDTTKRWFVPKYT